jgi:serine/threonine protein kinase
MDLRIEWRSDDTCWSLIKGVEEGLVFLHTNGVIHGDMKRKYIFLLFSSVIKNSPKKAENIGLSYNHSPVLFDFGNSFLLQGPPHGSRVIDREICTAWYRAPELFGWEGEQNHFNAKIDVWSLG